MARKRKKKRGKSRSGKSKAPDESWVSFIRRSNRSSRGSRYGRSVEFANWVAERCPAVGVRLVTKVDDREVKRNGVLCLSVSANLCLLKGAGGKWVFGKYGIKKLTTGEARQLFRARCQITESELRSDPDRGDRTGVKMEPGFKVPCPVKYASENKLNIEGCVTKDHQVPGE